MFLASGSGGSSVSFIILIVVLGGGYLLFVRSIQRKQRNQAAEQQNMRSALTAGTEIVTIGGLFGTVVSVDDDSVTLEISDGVTARYDRNAIARVITPVEDTSDDSDVEHDDSDDTTNGTDLDATANSVIETKD